MKKAIRLFSTIIFIFVLCILTSCQKKTNVLPNLEGMSREQIVEKMKNVDVKYEFYFTDDIINSPLDLDHFVRYGEGLKEGDTVERGSFIRIYTTVLRLTVDVSDNVKMDFELEPNQSFVETGTGKVILVRAIDGDTAVFKDPYTSDAENSVFTVRFLGIDTPESTFRIDPWGKAASTYTKNILSNSREIILESDGQGKDSYDRQLAYVWVDGKLLNLMIVQEAYSNSTAPLSSKYGQIMMDVAKEVRKTGRRYYGEIDPDYNYGGKN